MQISSLRAAINSGLVRSNRWRVLVDYPTYAGTTQDSQQASILARSTNTPASTLGVIDVSWGGRILPVPGDRTYEEFDITFIGVNDMNVYNAFVRWSENMNGSDSNQGLTSLSDVYSDFTLQLMDTNDNITKSYVLGDGFPSVVGPMSMDAGEMDGYSTFQVTIRYVSYSQPGVTR
jgi:hypothetical protein